IPSKKLEIQDKIILEENEDVIFQKIEGIEIFDNAKRIILTDAANKIVVMYDYNSGKILKFIDTKNQGHEWLERFLEMKPVAKFWLRDDIHYIPISQFTKYGLTEFDKKLVSFQFWTPKIINNRILLS